MKDQYTILYVDDERENLKAFKSIFRRFFHVLTANDAKEALELFRHQNIHLLLSDQRMPGMTGVELCASVMRQHPATKRIIITGYSERKIIDAALQAGKISKCIPKPWKTLELKAFLEQTLAA